jgi:hypothetical protein
VRQKIDRHGSCFCAQRLKIPDGPFPSKCQNLLRFGTEIQSGCQDAHLKVEHPIERINLQNNEMIFLNAHPIFTTPNGAVEGSLQRTFTFARTGYFSFKGNLLNPGSSPNSYWYCSGNAADLPHLKRIERRLVLETGYESGRLMGPRMN